MNVGRRILAVDLHPQRYAYAILESPAELLDWGVRGIYCKNQPNRNSRMRNSLRLLLRIWNPSVVVARTPRKNRTSRTQKRYRDLLREVRRLGIPIQRVQDKAMQTLLPEPRTKHVRAAAIVQQFPFISFMLPPVRKIFQTEYYRMDLFDAVALALVGSRLFASQQQQARSVS